MLLIKSVIFFEPKMPVFHSVISLSAESPTINAKRCLTECRMEGMMSLSLKILSRYDKSIVNEWFLTIRRDCEY